VVLGLSCGRRGSGRDVARGLGGAEPAPAAIQWSIRRNAAPSARFERSSIGSVVRNWSSSIFDGVWGTLSAPFRSACAAGKRGYPDPGGRVTPLSFFGPFAVC